MTLVELQALHTQRIGLLVGWAAGLGYLLSQGDSWRSTDPLKCPHCGAKHTYQDMLVSNGNSKATASLHNDRLANDFVIRLKDPATGQIRLATPEEHRPIGERWEFLGGRWGGRFGVPPAEQDLKVGWDPGHFETLRSTQPRPLS